MKKAYESVMHECILNGTVRIVAWDRAIAFFRDVRYGVYKRGMIRRPGCAHLYSGTFPVPVRERGTSNIYLLLR